jgi:hypothetical protein
MDWGVLFMGARWMVEAMIILLSLSVVMIIWPGMRKFILGFVRNAAVGLCLLQLAAVAFGPQLQVGLNLLTGGICGLFGLPGTAMLLILKGVM